MQRYFTTIYEPEAGYKWQKFFQERWPAYRAWIVSNSPATDYRTALAELKKHMPELVPLHQQLCYLVGADEVAATFLTGFAPPAYYSACSQAVSTLGNISLIRNYDYHMDRFEANMMLTSWNGRRVIANTDSLMGVLDGMNEDGLTISLTYGGRQVVGYGFGIPFIMRYILEFCTTVKEAVQVLKRVPSHMSYNVTLADRSGEFCTAQISPDRKTLISEAGFATNHQGILEWTENSDLNKTRERAIFLKSILKRGYTIEKLTKAFLKPPLYNNHFIEGLGTLYTAVYRPIAGMVELHWPHHQKMIQSFDNFYEETKIITFKQSQISEV